MGIRLWSRLSFVFLNSLARLHHPMQRKATSEMESPVESAIARKHHSVNVGGAASVHDYPNVNGYFNRKVPRDPGS